MSSYQGFYNGTPLNFQNDGSTGGNGPGTNTDDATAVASDILKDKTAYARGEKLIGTLEPGVDVSDTTAEVWDVAFRKAFHKADGSLATGTVTTHSPPGAVLKGVHNISVKEISSGKKYLDITGKMSSDALLRGGLEIGVEAELERFGNATAEDVIKGRTFTSVDGFNIEGTFVPETGIDTSDATAQPNDVVKGKTFYGASGEKEEGTVEEVSSMTYDVDNIDISNTNDHKISATIPFEENTMIREGGDISALVDLDKFGNATAEDVVSGKTFTSTNGFMVTGTYVPPEVGSGSGGSFEYSDERPSDWLPMPKPNDDELYALVHIPDNASTLFAFTVTCTGSYTVELGTVQNEQFVSTKEPTTLTNNTKYSTILNANDFEGPLTSTGMKQIMVKVSGDTITTWKNDSHPLRNMYIVWPIVEIRCRLPNATNVGVATGAVNNVLNNLRYFSWEGPNKLTDATKMFSACFLLREIIELDVSKVTNMSEMFNMCYNLRKFPDVFDTSNVTNMSKMFYYAHGCMNIPNMNTEKVTTMEAMFQGHRGITTAPKFDYSNVKTTTNMFNGCNCLLSAQNMNFASLTSATGMFTDCWALTSVTLDPTVEGWTGANLSAADCLMGHDALVALINSLPKLNTTSNRAFALNKNFGFDELTSNEKQIASDKGWTIV